MSNTCKYFVQKKLWILGYYKKIYSVNAIVLERVFCMTYFLKLFLYIFETYIYV